MAKTARLDQILLNLGYVHVETVARALRRQKSHGGRLGSHLVELGAITEEQLLEALAEQFRIPTLSPAEKDIPLDLVGKMPPDIIAEGLALPLAWNAEQKVLSVVAANPGDQKTMRRVKEAFMAKGIRVALGADSLLAALGRQLISGERSNSSGSRRISLPELFATEPEESGGPQEAVEEEVEATTPVVMITNFPSRKNFLPPLFEREGFRLTVVTEREEAAEALGQTGIDSVLLSQEMVGPFEQWQDEGLPDSGAPLIVFPSVSGALLENPLPYEATVQSLRSAVRALADYRCGELGASPPYGLIATDVAVLAEHLGLSRVACDVLDLCIHLLLPAPLAAGTDPIGNAEPFGAFASSLELANRIKFPWHLDAVLAACHRLYSGQADPTERGEFSAETHLAAQVLSLVWYRHNHAPDPSGDEEERMIGLRTTLRERASTLATTELIEAYLGLISDRGGPHEDVGDKQVLLVGGERISRALSPALQRVGREIVSTAELADAQTMTERRPPAAIVLDHEEFPTQVDKFSRVAKLGGAALLFVLTDSTDPALVLNLLDVGVDDVFGPPHDFDLVAARINRAIRSRARGAATDKQQAGQFSATFEVFSFLDLVQMLSQGLKTVRIELSHGGQESEIFMRKGRISHATLGDVEGEAAVYGVIAWEDDGEFTVSEETSFPADTIEVSTESVLMEGLRLLDESKREESA